jgi:hypothetical protein
MKPNPILTSTAPTTHTHLRNDLEALTTWLTANKKADSLHAKIDCHNPTSYSAAAEALTADIKAEKAWLQIPRKRRFRAEHLYGIALKNAITALALGGLYSGKTTEEIIWSGLASASTTRNSGDSYSRNKWQHRTDANHRIYLDLDGLLAMEHNVELLKQSAEEGLLVIALYKLKKIPHVYKAVWVKQGTGKTIVDESGWIAYDPVRQCMYHSTISSADASKALTAKVEAALEEERHKQALLEATPKMERRARLVAKLCGKIHATTEDAHKLGYCDAGIKAFRKSHRIGKSASLPELIETGNPLAIKLALYLARQVTRDKSKKSNFELKTISQH